MAVVSSSNSNPNAAYYMRCCKSVLNLNEADPNHPLRGGGLFRVYSPTGTGKTSDITRVLEAVLDELQEPGDSFVDVVYRHGLRTILCEPTNNIINEQEIELGRALHRKDPSGKTPRSFFVLPRNVSIFATAILGRRRPGDNLPYNLTPAVLSDKVPNKGSIEKMLRAVLDEDGKKAGAPGSKEDKPKLHDALERLAAIAFKESVDALLRMRVDYRLIKADPHEFNVNLNEETCPVFSKRERDQIEDVLDKYGYLAKPTRPRSDQWIRLLLKLAGQLDPVQEDGGDVESGDIIITGFDEPRRRHEEEVEHDASGFINIFAGKIAMLMHRADEWDKSNPAKADKVRGYIEEFKSSLACRALLPAMLWREEGRLLITTTSKLLNAFFDGENYLDLERIQGCVLFIDEADSTRDFMLSSLVDSCQIVTPQEVLATFMRSAQITPPILMNAQDADKGDFISEAFGTGGFFKIRLITYKECVKLGLFGPAAMELTEKLLKEIESGGLADARSSSRNWLSLVHHELTSHVCMSPIANISKENFWAFQGSALASLYRPLYVRRGGKGDDDVLYLTDIGQEYRRMREIAGDDPKRLAKLRDQMKFCHISRYMRVITDLVGRMVLDGSDLGYRKNRYVYDRNVNLVWSECANGMEYGEIARTLSNMFSKRYLLTNVRSFRDAGPDIDPFFLYGFSYWFFFLDQDLARIREATPEVRFRTGRIVGSPELLLFSAISKNIVFLSSATVMIERAASNFNFMAEVEMCRSFNEREAAKKGGGHRHIVLGMDDPQLEGSLGRSIAHLLESRWKSRGIDEMASAGRFRFSPRLSLRDEFSSFIDSARLSIPPKSEQAMYFYSAFASNPPAKTGSQAMEEDLLHTFVKLLDPDAQDNTIEMRVKRLMEHLGCALHAARLSSERGKDGRRLFQCHISYDFTFKPFKQFVQALAGIDAFWNQDIKLFADRFKKAFPCLEAESIGAADGFGDCAFKLVFMSKEGSLPIRIVFMDAAAQKRPGFREFYERLLAPLAQEHGDCEGLLLSTQIKSASTGVNLLYKCFDPRLGKTALRDINSFFLIGFEHFHFDLDDKTIRRELIDGDSSDPKIPQFIYNVVAAAKGGLISEGCVEQLMCDLSLVHQPGGSSASAGWAVKKAVSQLRDQLYLINTEYKKSFDCAAKCTAAAIQMLGRLDRTPSPIGDLSVVFNCDAEDKSCSRKPAEMLLRYMQVMPLNTRGLSTINRLVFSKLMQSESWGRENAVPGGLVSFQSAPVPASAVISGFVHLKDRINSCFHGGGRPSQANKEIFKLFARLYTKARRSTVMRNFCFSALDMYQDFRQLPGFMAFKGNEVRKNNEVAIRIRNWLDAEVQKRRAQERLMPRCGNGMAYWSDGEWEDFDSAMASSRSADDMVAAAAAKFMRWLCISDNAADGQCGCVKACDWICQIKPPKLQGQRGFWYSADGGDGQIADAWESKPSDTPCRFYALDKLHELKFDAALDGMGTEEGDEDILPERNGAASDASARIEFNAYRRLFATTVLRAGRYCRPTDRFFDRCAIQPYALYYLISPALSEENLGKCFLAGGLHPNLMGGGEALGCFEYYDFSFHDYGGLCVDAKTWSTSARKRSEGRDFISQAREAIADPDKQTYFKTGRLICGKIRALRTIEGAARHEAEQMRLAFINAQRSSLTAGPRLLLARIDPDPSSQGQERLIPIARDGWRYTASDYAQSDVIFLDGAYELECSEDGVPRCARLTEDFINLVGWARDDRAQIDGLPSD